MDRKKVRFRVILSFVFLVSTLTGATVAYNTIVTGEESMGTPLLLRKSFQWNEEVLRILRSNKRLSEKRPKPPKGKEPRVNGMLGLESNLELEEYKVQIESGKKKIFLPLPAFKVIPKVRFSTLFKCIEGWSEDTAYGGAKFSDFMNFYDVGRKPDGKFYSYVGFETPDKEYYVSIDMESMLHDQTVLAYEMNGAPLSLENGAPLRLIIPIKYGIKSIKRIGRIFFSDNRPRDYWAEQGYDWYSGL